MTQALAMLGAYTLACFLYGLYKTFMENRDGNSGRYKHWSVED